MLFKWIFTILALLWLYQALRPLLVSATKTPPRRPPEPAPPPQERPVSPGKRSDDEGEYIEYEEVK